MTPLSLNKEEGMSLPSSVSFSVVVPFFNEEAAAYAVADEVMLQRAMHGEDGGEYAQRQDLRAAEAALGCQASPTAFTRPTASGRRNHRWDAVTGLCQHCGREPVTEHEKRSLATTRRGAQKIMRIVRAQ